MKSKRGKLELMVVIQIGGTSDEKYLHCFFSMSAAKKFIRSADRAAYCCLGPFRISLENVGHLAIAAKNVMRWAKRERLESKHLSELSYSLAEVQKDFAAKA